MLRRFRCGQIFLKLGDYSSQVPSRFESFSFRMNVPRGFIVVIAGFIGYLPGRK